MSSMACLTQLIVVTCCCGLRCCFDTSRWSSCLAFVSDGQTPTASFLISKPTN